jgi:hypothetical protein
MNWTKLSIAATLAAALIASPATAYADPVWVSAQPRIQVMGIGECNKLAQLYRINPDTPVPPGCVNRGGFKGLLSPPGDTPPLPTGDAPPPPGDAP